MGWTEWSPCSIIQNEYEKEIDKTSLDNQKSIQWRRKICADSRVCGRESRNCEPTESTSMGFLLFLQLKFLEQIINSLRRSNCPKDVCCGVYGGCKMGIMQNSLTKRLEWCLNPCESNKKDRKNMQK